MYIAVVKSIHCKFQTAVERIELTKDMISFIFVSFQDKDIDKIDTDLWYKPTHTRHYSSFNSSLPWNYKVS